MIEIKNSDEIINEIVEGGSKSLRQLGLNKKNVDDLLGSEKLIQVQTPSGKPFLRAIRNPTPLIYAILCEQLDTVLYLVLHLHSSFEKSVVFFYYYSNYNVLFDFFYGIYFSFFIGFRFIMHLQ